MDYDYLYHYGIKGQKWGVRRYQNKDGSLTKAGKKRYNTDYLSEARGMTDQELRSKVDRMNLERRYIALEKNRSYKVSRALDVADKAASTASSANNISKKFDKTKKKNDKNPDIATESLNAVSKSVSAAKRVDRIAKEGIIAKRSKAKLENMTDADLRNTVNRMDLEQQYSSLRQESVNRGRATARDILDVAGDVLAVGASVVTIAVAIKKLRNQ